MARLHSLVIEAEPNSRFEAVEASIGAVVQIAVKEGRRRIGLRRGVAQHRVTCPVPPRRQASPWA
jgi:hypothetical protein